MTELRHGGMQFYNRPTDDSHWVELVISHVRTGRLGHFARAKSTESVRKVHNQSSKTASENTVNRHISVSAATDDYLYSGSEQEGENGIRVEGTKYGVPKSLCKEYLPRD